MSALIEFLTKRLDKDEAVARAAVSPDRPGTHWHWVDGDTDEAVNHLTVEDDPIDLSLRSVEEYPTRDVGDLPAFVLNHVEADDPRALPHIARHDPARVLREVNVKRRMIEATQRMADRLGVYEEQTAGWEFLSLAAEVYHQHPDWRADWYEHREEWA